MHRHQSSLENCRPDPPERLLVLASASPRRMEMLARIGVRHRVHPTDIDETPRIGEAPERFALRVSREKADAAAPAYPAEPVLGADTVVVARGVMLGKPAHEGAARQMLGLLSGATHQVMTGYHLRLPRPDGEPARVSRVVTTEVTVRALLPEEIDAYLKSGEWRGKAGAYAIQGRFSCFVRALSGSYDNVVGLPLCQVVEDLRAQHALDADFPTWTP